MEEEKSPQTRASVARLLNTASRHLARAVQAEPRSATALYLYAHATSLATGLLVSPQAADRYLMSRVEAALQLISSRRRGAVPRALDKSNSSTGVVNGVVCPLLSRLLRQWAARRVRASASSSFIHNGGAADPVVIERLSAALQAVAALDDSNAAAKALRVELDKAFAYRHATVLKLWAHMRLAQSAILRELSRTPVLDFARNTNGAQSKLLRRLQAQDSAAEELLKLFFECATDGRHDVLGLLTELGVSINGSGSSDAPLLRYAAAGNARLVRALAASGANMRITSPTGDPPLVVATRAAALAREEAHVHAAMLDVVDALLECKADVEQRTRDNHTALIVAAQRGEHEIVQRLAQQGDGIVNATTAKGETALLFATLACSPRAVRWLLEAKANPNTRDTHVKLTPLMALTSSVRGADPSAAEVVRLLVAAGASPTDATAESWNAAHLAADAGHAALLPLVAIGDALDARDERQKTPLRIAVERGHVEAVRSLINAGADTNRCGLSAHAGLARACGADGQTRAPPAVPTMATPLPSGH